MKKLIAIKRARRWPFTEAIDAMADRELELIAAEASARAAGCSPIYPFHDPRRRRQNPPFQPGLSAASGEEPLKQAAIAGRSTRMDASSPGSADTHEIPPAQGRADASDPRHARQVEVISRRSGDEESTEFDSVPRCAGCGRPTDDDGQCKFCSREVAHDT